MRGASLLHLRHRPCSAASGKLAPQSSQSDCAPSMMSQIRIIVRKKSKKNGKRIKVGIGGMIVSVTKKCLENEGAFWT